MTTYNKLPYSNQFERGHSFNWAGHWKEGKYYYNDSYVTDFVVYNNTVLVCRKNHMSSSELEPKIIYIDGKISDVDSSYWEFVLGLDNKGIVSSSSYISSATEEDKALDNSIIIGEPYLKLIYLSGAYTYIPAKDLAIGINVGLPMMTQQMLDYLPEESAVDDYVLIPDETDITDNGLGGTYLNILFSAIRKLQAEVAKLRNSFRFGIDSYTGTDTVSSEIVSEYSSIQEDEPLWSIEEDDLSEISDATIDFEDPFIQLEPRSAIDYDSTGYAEILTKASTTQQVSNAYQEVTDTKIFLYLTVDKPTVTVNLKEIFNSDSNITIDLNSLVTGYNASQEKYNICVLVSRKMSLEDDDTEYGKNYIWISIGYFNTNRVIREGYYNLSTQTLQKNLYEISNKYYIDTVTFSDLTLYKFNAYSKYQDFSHEVIQSQPDDSGYKYRAAHLTIRAVKSLSELESISDRLQTNELVWQDDQNILWINGKNGPVPISGSSIKPDSGMTEQEMIEKLEELGIVYIDNNELQLSNISDVTFINNDTNKKFKFAVDSEGNLTSTELPETSLSDRVNNISLSTEKEIRGFVAKLFAGEAHVVPTDNGDLKLNADRIKIGAIYAPLAGDTKFGCSHGYIELENTSNKDFPLKGCYLHYVHPNSTNSAIFDCESLALDGILPANGTYLIRCKKYADPKLDSDVFINVDTFDIEWYVDGNLLDLTHNKTLFYGFALTYGDKVNDAAISPLTVFITANDSGDKNAPYKYVYNFIDDMFFNVHPSNATGTWGANPCKSYSNTITKNTFELDPAKQAYQALTKYDSSRIRLDNVTNDIQYLNLDKEFIEFPNSDDKYPVSLFTPKSSKEHKNVSTDKTKLDKDKPNMVTCSFGINIYTTRAFNWISAGEFDEYVFINTGENTWLKFESYKAGDEDKTMSETPIARKEFGATAINSIYKRIIGDFPGDGSHYTSHKCIIQFNSGSPVSAKETFTYIVGRANKDGNPDLEHCSGEYTFTLYPISCIPRIYQITDQQGFHWIEYQVWAAAADKVNERILSDTNNENIIPILINTGDMTQNGTRINEWLDYYNAGRKLFSHLEQMNVVGNNDLCDTDVNILGTGDDPGKSNGYYFHVFYCYEIDENNMPVITGDAPDSTTRYIPSLYYFDSTNYRFIMINSEITLENCKNWFHKSYNGQTVNIYTGWNVPDTSQQAAEYCNNFTTVYTIIYRMLNTKGAKNAIAVCHEMPFTVITKDSLKASDPGVYSNYRSCSAAKSTLVGSHTNQITGTDEKAMHWLSRLLEHFGVKLCIGGHKHTYACTYPIRENYFYMSDDVLTNSLDAPVIMNETLENDDVTWKYPNDWSNEALRGYNTSKKPYVKGPVVTSATGGGCFSPMIEVQNLTGGVTYFMCQATGYKLTSNKELPSNYQHFSKLIPETTSDEKADGAQQYPMFSIVSMSNDSYNIKLIRICHIKNDAVKHEFTQSSYDTASPAFQYASPTIDSRYCEWTANETSIISI